MRSHRDARPDPRAAAAILGAAAFTLALFSLSGLVVTNWLWGLGAARYWPPAGQVALLLVGASGFLPPVRTVIERGLDRLGTAWERARLAGDLAAGVLVGLVLFALRDPVRFTGDSAMREGLLMMGRDGAARLMSHRFPLDLAANEALPRWLIGAGLDPATALQVVGGLVGGCFTVTVCRFLRATGARRGALAAGALVVLGAGTLPHFAGYDKFGPLMLGLALAATGALRLARPGAGLLPLVAGAVIAVLSHRSGYLVLPAVGWSMLTTFTARREPKARRAVLLAAASVAGVAAAMIPATLDLARRLDLPTHLPGGGVARARDALGATAPLLRLSDALNLLWYLVPLWLVGVVAGLAARPRRPAAAPGPPGAGVTAWLALAPMAAMILIVSPGGGWARDWDVAVGPATLASLATAYALVAWWQKAGTGGTAGPVATLALGAAIGLWGVNADARISHRRIEALLAGRPALGDATRASAYDLLGARALSAGDPERAVMMLTRAIASAPNPRYYYQLGIAEEVAGRIDRAEENYRRAARLMPTMPDPWVGLARTALVRGDSLSARAYAESALARDPRGSDPARVRAILSQRRLAPATAGAGR